MGTSLRKSREFPKFAYRLPRVQIFPISERDIVTDVVSGGHVTEQGKVGSGRLSVTAHQSTHCLVNHPRAVCPIEMLLELIGVYLGALLGILLATVCLILCGLSWGPLPHIYIRFVEFLQNFYPQAYPSPLHDSAWPSIIRRSDTSALEKHRNGSLASFKFSSLPSKRVIDVCSDAFKAGFESIAQDDISVAFDEAPPYCTTLLEWPGRLPFPDGPREITRGHILGYCLAVAFRYGVLVPIRVGLIGASFAFMGVAVLASFVISFSKQQKTRIAVTYCRLFSAGIGLVAKYHNPQFRPKQPGIAVSNHMSPNDVQIICADVDPTGDFSYTVTGQKHSGIIWAIESLVSRLASALWLDRASADDRKNFMKIVIKEAAADGPVLLFPEGYCSNNTRVLQFRRAVFQQGLTIYPIAIRQQARFGDSFWSKGDFGAYLFKLLTSWAVVYDVIYLEPQTRLKDEPSQVFATRVQNLIAKAAGAQRTDFDGRLWYRKEEQERMKVVQMENLAKRVNEITSSCVINDPIIENCDLVVHNKGEQDSLPSPHSPYGCNSPLISLALR